MSFWSRLFGREAEIDYSAPLQARCAPAVRRHHNNSNADLKVTRMDTGETVILSRGCTLDLPNNIDVTMEGMKPARSRARKTPSAHGKRPGKPKSRSQKKPARKRSRK